MGRLSAVCSKSFLSAKNHETTQSNELYHLKVLIPTKVVGPIIGKGGSVVTNLENTYHVKITVSSINDIYPGSDDRVCLISGDLTENILAVNDYIMTEVSAMPDMGRNSCFDYNRKINFERSKQVKFLIPQISAAKIIGHRGKTINWMKSTSGSFIQISQSSRNLRLYERCIIVAGDLKSNKKACRMIFSAIAEDTKATFYKNFSYSNIDSPIPSAFPTGPALAGRKTNRNVETSKETDETCNISGHVNNKTEPSKCSEFLGTIQAILAENAYNASIIEKAKKAFHFLIRHDILNVCSPVILNFWIYNSPLGRCTDDNTPAAALGNASVSSNVRPAMHGNASMSPNVRPAMDGNASVSSNVRPAMHGNASVSSNVRPAMDGNAYVSSNVRPAMDGNAYVSSNVRPAMDGNAYVSSNVRPAMDGNASFSYRPTISGNPSMSFSDIPTMGTGNTSVSSNVRPAMGGKASVSFSDEPTVGGNTFIPLSDRPEMGGNTSMPFNDIPTLGNENASVSFNDTPTMGIGNASAHFSDTPTVGSYPSDTTNLWGNLMQPTVSENLASSFFTSGRNQDATPLHYVPLWNRFSSPLVSINNCAHINMPNYSGSSELPHEDLRYPMVAGRHPGTSVVPDVGMKFA